MDTIYPMTIPWKSIYVRTVGSFWMMWSSLAPPKKMVLHFHQTTQCWPSQYNTGHVKNCFEIDPPRVGKTSSELQRALEVARLQKTCRTKSPKMYQRGWWGTFHRTSCKRIYGSVSRVAPPPPPMVWVPPPLPPYLMHFAHATVAKLTFPYFCMHAAVAKRTFSFCWMNPLAGFGGSIARNCGEMQILSSKNGSAQCTGHFNAQQMESYTYTYPCTYIFININSYICKNIYVYLHIHICTYPYTYIHIYINIYIHTSSTATTTTTHTTGGGVYYTDPLPYHYYHNYFHHHHHYHHHHAPITHTTGGG